MSNPAIKAVLFDLYNTLVRYHPPREEIQVQLCGEFGFEVTPEAVRRPIYAGDEFYYQENARSPVARRSQEEKMAVWAQYQAIVLKGIGMEASPQVIAQMLKRFQEFKMKLVLFEDVLPTLEELKGRRLTLGLVSNIDRDIEPLCHELGLSQYLDIRVTSQEVGADKPQPPIFEEALKRAGVGAGEALYIGDQYHYDVKGAQGVGMRALLLDRYDLFPEIADCPRISSLTQVTEYI